MPKSASSSSPPFVKNFSHGPLVPSSSTTFMELTSTVVTLPQSLVPTQKVRSDRLLVAFGRCGVF